MKRPEDMTRPELEEEVAYLRGELGIADRATTVAVLTREFSLTPAQGQVLAMLHAARGRVLSSAQILDVLPAQGRDADAPSNLVASHVCRLRKALGAASLLTLNAAGYYLSPRGMAIVSAVLGSGQMEQAA